MPRQKRLAHEAKGDNFIKFLGTAGARFVMIKQLRASGGIWLRSAGANILIDPGPGSLVRCAHARPKMDPCSLDAIILTHRHLDHSNDVNVMIEAMTEGGFKKRGTVFAPADALGDDALILKHARGYVDSLVALQAKTTYRVGDFEFMTGPRNAHPAETYGLKFTLNNKSVGLMGDTALYPELFDFYHSDILIINVVFYEPRPAVQHLSFQDAQYIIEKLTPETAILTHFGMTMLRAKPHFLVERLNRHVDTHVIAASDGMTFYP